MTRWGCLLLAALSGCGSHDPVPSAAAPAMTSSSVDSSAVLHERGRKIYNFRCYFCHGYSGDARTLASTYLSPPPRDFTHADARTLTAPQLQAAVRDGRPGTAMKGFRDILSDADIAAVVAFVRHEFIDTRAVNTRYHTADNGWPDHDRHRAAFAFARGDLALDTPWDRLDDEQRRGKRLFLASCVSCHDRARVEQPGAAWETRALSYPRDAYCTSCHDAPDGNGLHTGATRPSDRPQRQPTAATLAATYAVHDRKPSLSHASALERAGETLYQRNCAFCHAADGTAKSWIGRFLEPHPRDLTDAVAMAGVTRERLVRVIEDGVDGTSMPGWKAVLQPDEIDAVAAYVQRAFMSAATR